MNIKYLLKKEKRNLGLVTTAAVLANTFFLPHYIVEEYFQMNDKVIAIEEMKGRFNKTKKDYNNKNKIILCH